MGRGTLPADSKQRNYPIFDRKIIKFPGYNQQFSIKVVQKLQFLNNNHKKQQNAGHFARFVQ
jgi:hypothetical protein